MKRASMDRREFIKSTSLFTAAGSAYFATGGVADLLAVERSARSGQNAPFEIIAIGDSIIWGAGLSDNQKFTYQVASFIKSKLPGREVHVHNFAHAGARILPNAEQDEKLPAHAEVPTPYPSITWQVARAANELASTNGRRYVPPIHPQVSRDNVALVLLSGGLNDVGMKRLLTPDPTPGAMAVRSAGRTACVDRMKTLLPTVLSTFPNAKVVVTNYYPLISEQSDAARVIELVRHWGVPTENLDVTQQGSVMTQLIRQSAAFHEETTRGFREAVAATKPFDIKAVKVGGTTDSTKQLRAGLAEVALTAAHAYAAKTPLLFQLYEPDPVLVTRSNACLATFGAVDGLCKYATAAYPNPRGAAAYAAAVINTLQQIMPELSAGRTDRLRTIR
jgi:hypothetical protein